jgi:hypothetical protein
MWHSTSPDDIIDGEPIDETSFWLNVRSLIRSPAYSVPLFFLRRSSEGHFWPLPLSLLCPYKPSPWTMPLRFRPQRPDHSHIPAPCVVCHLSLDSRRSVPICSHIGNVIHISVLTTLTFALLGFTALFHVVRHPLRHQLRTLGLTFCK